MKKLILVLGFLFLGIGVIGFFYGVGAEPGLHNRAMHFSPEYLKGGVALMSAMICRQLG